MHFSILSFIILLISQIVAWVILIMGDYRMDISMIIALIGLGGSMLSIAGGIWAQVVQFKKDGQRIDNVNDTATSVKNDTTDMKPKIDNINENTKVIRDDITRSILPQMNSIANLNSGVAELLESKHIDDAVKQKVSSYIENPVYIQNAVSLIYEKNAALEVKVSELNVEKAHLDMQVKILKEKNEKLLEENQKLKQELSKYHSRENEERSR